MMLNERANEMLRAIEMSQSRRTIALQNRDRMFARAMQTGLRRGMNITEKQMAQIERIHALVVAGQ